VIFHELCFLHWGGGLFSSDVVDGGQAHVPVGSTELQPVTFDLTNNSLSRATTPQSNYVF